MLEGAYSATTDVWSAGVILHLLPTGRNPFRGPSKAATEHRVRAGTFKMEDGGGWAEVSPAAKAMVKVLLSAAADRPAAKQALRTEWIKERNNLGGASAALNESIPSDMQRLCDLSGWADKQADASPNMSERS